MTFTEEHVGQYVRNESGDLLKVVSYCSHPTVQFQYVTSPLATEKVCVTVAANSPAASKMKLVGESESRILDEYRESFVKNRRSRF